MELDNLKSSWKSIAPEMDNNAFDIIAATKKEIQSPLFKLKKTYKKQITLLPLLFIFLIFLTFREPEVKSSLFIWMALIALPVIFIYYYFNLYLIKQIEKNEGPLKFDLERKLHTLIKSNQLYLIFTRVLMLAVVVLIELLIHKGSYHLIEGLADFKNIQLPFRILIYLVALAIHYGISKFSFHLHFGQYLNKLRGLVLQMQ